MAEPHALQDRMASELESLRRRVAALEPVERELDACKRERDELRQELGRVRDLVEVSTNWFWETDPDGRFTRLSPNFVEISGMSLQRLRQMTREDLRNTVPPREEEHAAWEEHLEVLARREPFREFVCSFRDASGGIRFASSSAKPVFGEDGDFRGYRGASRDVTAEVNALQDMERARRRWEDAVEAIPASVHLFDAEERFVTANSRARTLFPEYGALYSEGVHFADLMRFAYHEKLMREGDLEQDERSWVEYRLERFRRPPEYYQYQRHDGRWIRVYDRRMPDGGTVSIRFDVSEQVAAEQSLRRSEAQSRRLIEEMQMPMLVHQRFKPRFANRACAELLGLPSVEALLDMGDLRSTFTPQDWERAQAGYDRQLNGGQPPARFERRLRLPTGGYRDVEAFAQVIEWEGEPAMLVTYHDLTDIKRAADALSRSESRFRKLFDESLYGMLIHRNREPIYVNPAFAKLFGYDSREEVLALRTIDAWVAEEEKTRVRKYADSRLQKGDAPRRYEYRGRRKDGTLCWIENTVTTLEWEGERAILATMADVTARREAEEAVRESETRFRDFAEVASDWFWETGPDHRFTYISERFTSATGVPVDKLIGKTRRELAPAGGPPVAWDAHYADLEARRPFRGFEYGSAGREGPPRYARISGKPMFTSDGLFLGYRGTGTDITREIEVRAEADRAHARLHDAIESLPAAFALYDERDRLVMVNSRVRDQLPTIADHFTPGRTYREIVERSAYSGLYSDAVGREREWVDERLAIRESGSDTRILPLADGRWLRALDRKTIEGGIVSIRLDITELKQVEAALRESEQRFKDFAEVASDWFWETGPDLRFTFFSGRFLERAGLDPGHLLGRTRMEVAQAAGSEDIWERHLRDLERHKPFRDFVYSYKDAAGQPVFLRISGKPVFDAKGAFLGYRGTGANISAEVAAHRKAERAHARLVDAVDALPAALYLFDAEQRLILANRRVQEEFPEMRDVFVPGTTQPEIARAAAERGLIAEAVGRERDYQTERNERFHRASEPSEMFYLPTRRWLQALDRRTRDGGTVSVRVDITDLKTREEALRKSEERFRGLAEGSIQAILVHRGGRPVFVNSAFVDMFGYASMEDALSIDLSELPYLAEHERPRVQRYMQARLRGERAPDRYRFEGLRADGSTVWGEVVASQVTWDGEPAVLGTYTDVTENVLAEEALRESEERFRKYFELPLIGMCVTSQDQRFLQVNSRLCDMVGYTEDELLGMTWVQVTHPDDVETSRGALDALNTRDQASLSWDMRYIRKDGTIFDVTLSSAPLRRADGSTSGFVTLIQDISFRKQAERRLRSQQMLLQTVFDTIPLWISVKNRRGEYLMVNRLFEQDMGISASGGQTLMDVEHVPVELRKRLVEYDREVLEHGRAVVIPDYSITLVDGRVAKQRSVKVPLRGEGGVVEGIVTIAEDMTERERTQEELRSSRELLQTVFDALPLWVSVKDQDRRYVMINRRRELDSSLPADAYIGKRILEIPHLSMDIRQDSDRRDRWVIERGETLDAEFEFATPDGKEHWMHTIRVPMRARDGSIRGLVVVDEDITDRRNLEEQLRQSQKMEAIGQLAGGVAHDFNNLLQIISGYCQFALNEAGAESSIGQDLKEVLEATERGSHLTRQLLAFGRRHALHREHIDLNDVVLSLSRMLKRLFEERIELVVAPEPDVGNVHADASMIQQVLMNLCLNARDAMPDGGVLTVSTARAAFDASFCETHPWALPGQFVTVSVQDTGTGIPPEHLDRIFEPFFTTKSQGKGTGLGLAMAYGIIRQHDGFLRVDSELGKGSRFVVHLPATQLSDHDDQVGAQAPEGGHETILVAEDEPRVRDMAVRVLKQAGYAVYAARDGEEALSTYESLRGRVDLIVLDIVMPKKDGSAVYEALRGARSQVPMLICSGNSSGALVDKAAKDNRLRLLHKPYLADDLLGEVRVMLDEFPG